MLIASNSPLWATCVPPASLTCSLPWWAITQAKHKERQYEYSLQHHARIFPWLAGRHARDLLRHSALLLVGAPRTLGKPLGLSHAVHCRCRLSLWLPDQHDESASPNAWRMARSRSVPARCVHYALRNFGRPDHGDSSYSRNLLLTR